MNNIDLKKLFTKDEFGLIVETFDQIFEEAVKDREELLDDVELDNMIEKTQGIKNQLDFQLAAFELKKEMLKDQGIDLEGDDFEINIRMLKTNDPEKIKEMIESEDEDAIEKNSEVVGQGIDYLYELQDKAADFLVMAEKLKMVKNILRKLKPAWEYHKELNDWKDGNTNG